MKDDIPAPLGREIPALIRRRVSLETFYEGVELFLLGASFRTIAQLWVVPVHLVQRLVQTREFSEVARALKPQVRATESIALSRLIHQSLDAVTQRLEHGDPYVAASGEIKFKPIAAKDAATIAALLYDRREKVDREVEGKAGVVDDDAMHLIEVAAALDSFRRRREERQVIDLTASVTNDDAQAA
jgi:hypothetical protein